MKIGAWMRTKREERGWSMSELGSKIGVSDVQVSRIETGARNPSYETALRIARAFGEDSSFVLRMAGHRPVEMANAG
jgi:transcriptional regulator with XRE-family HTH domain